MTLDEITKQFMQELKEQRELQAAELKEQRESQARREEAQTAELKEQREAHKKQIDTIMLQMQGMQGSAGSSQVGGRGGGSPPVQSAQQIILAKQQSVFTNLMKSDLKSYKFGQQKGMKDWLRAFDTKIDILSKAVELKVDELTDDNYANMIRSKLEDEVAQDVQIKFASSIPEDVREWSTITKKQLKEFLVDQYENKEPVVAALLHAIGHKRFKKTTEDVKAHRSKFWDKLPAGLKPTDQEGLKTLADILHRTLYYLSLDDAYLQKKLFELEESKQTYNSFYDAAVLAEAQRAHYNSISENAGILDSSLAVNIQKAEIGSHNSGYRGSWRGRGRGRGQQQQQQQQQQQEQQQQYQGYQTRADEKSRAENYSQGSNYRHEDKNASDYNGGSKRHYYKNYGQRRSTACYTCGEEGHFAYQCGKRSAPLEKSSDNVHKASMEFLNEGMNKPDYPIPNVFSFDVEEKPDASSEQSNSKEPDKIIAGVKIHNVCGCKMEMDTGASDSMLTYRSYQFLLGVCKDNGVPPPKLEKSTRVLRQADGTMSQKVRGHIHLRIERADMPERAGIFKVLVADGPNNILGRPVLKMLWQEGYEELVRDVAESRLKEINSVKSVQEEDLEVGCSSETTSQWDRLPIKEKEALTASRVDRTLGLLTVNVRNLEEMMLKILRKENSISCNSVRDGECLQGTKYDYNDVSFQEGMENNMS